MGAERGDRGAGIGGVLGAVWEVKGFWPDRYCFLNQAVILDHEQALLKV